MYTILGVGLFTAGVFFLLQFLAPKGSVPHISRGRWLGVLTLPVLAIILYFKAPFDLSVVVAIFTVSYLLTLFTAARARKYATQMTYHIIFASCAGISFAIIALLYFT